MGEDPVGHDGGQDAVRGQKLADHPGFMRRAYSVAATGQ